MRQAIWITRFDWASRDELRALVTKALGAGVTDLLVQARGAGDALYRSDVAPASPNIADRLGGEPLWDPLAEVCELASMRDDVRVHAWINVLSGWPATSPDACTGLEPSAPGSPDHLLLRHPEAVLVDASGRPMSCPNDTDYVWVSPTHPGVVRELEAVTDELSDRYALAGIHLDRIRFPGGGWRDPHDGSTRPWEAVTALVGRIRDRLHDDHELTASLVPDYGRAVNGGREHLVEFAQDGWRWVELGLVDSVMPMVYSPIAPGEPDDWGRLVGEHRRATGETRCWTPIFAGLDATMIAQQLRQARNWAGIGVAWYSAGLAERHDRWDVIRRVGDELGR